VQKTEGGSTWRGFPRKPLWIHVNAADPEFRAEEPERDQGVLSSMGLRLGMVRQVAMSPRTWLQAAAQLAPVSPPAGPLRISRRWPRSSGRSFWADTSTNVSALRKAVPRGAAFSFPALGHCGVCMAGAAKRLPAAFS
jgi:hypothetical protein